MQYALLAYGSQRIHAGPVEGTMADVLARPYVTGWARLHADGSATTVRNGEGRTLLTDGPFIETKEFLRSVRDFARKEWPLRGSSAGVLM